MTLSTAAKDRRYVVVGIKKKRKKKVNIKRSREGSSSSKPGEQTRE
jgi:hypothetical protein